MCNRPLPFCDNGGPTLFYSSGLASATAKRPHGHGGMYTGHGNLAGPGSRFGGGRSVWEVWRYVRTDWEGAPAGGMAREGRREVRWEERTVSGRERECESTVGVGVGVGAVSAGGRVVGGEWVSA